MQFLTFLFFFFWVLVFFGFFLQQKKMDLVDIDKVLDDFELNEDNNDYNNKSENLNKIIIKNNNKSNDSGNGENSISRNDGELDFFFDIGIFFFFYCFYSSISWKLIFYFSLYVYIIKKNIINH